MTLRFTPTPTDLAVFDTSTAEAAELLRGDEGAVNALGLQHRADPERGLLFDYTDVVNAALRSGSGVTVPELARRLLMRFAAHDPPSWFAPMTWTVAIHRLPGGQQFRSAVPDLMADGVEPLDDPGAEYPAPLVTSGHQSGPYQVRVRLTGEHHEITEPGVRAAFDAVLDAFDSGAVTYQAIGEPLRGDHHRSWDLGVADCVVAGKVLADRLRVAGFQARSRRGYLLGLVGTDHGWCEVLLGGRWRSLDPIFAFLAAEHGHGGGEEFRRACCGSRFNRLLPCAVPSSAPLVLRPDGAPAPAWAFGAVTSRVHPNAKAPA